MRILGGIIAACLLFTSSLFAQEDAAGATVVDQEPENIAGVLNDEGKMNYGSPRVEQQLAADHVFVVKYYSRDKEYGRTVEKPIMVGHGDTIIKGPKNEQRFLNALAGPNMERVAYKRRGSGHSFETDNSGEIGSGTGLLDIYEVAYDGLSEPIVLYLNMYDSDTLKIPVGFRMKYAPNHKPPALEETE